MLLVEYLFHLSMFLGCFWGLLISFFVRLWLFGAKISLSNVPLTRYFKQNLMVWHKY